jgi:hypothetical protein
MWLSGSYTCVSVIGVSVIGALVVVDMSVITAVIVVDMQSLLALCHAV